MIAVYSTVRHRCWGKKPKNGNWLKQCLKRGWKKNAFWRITNCTVYSSSFMAIKYVRYLKITWHILRCTLRWSCIKTIFWPLRAAPKLYKLKQTELLLQNFLSASFSKYDWFLSRHFSPNNVLTIFSRRPRINQIRIKIGVLSKSFHFFRQFPWPFQNNLIKLSMHLKIDFLFTLEVFLDWKRPSLARWKEWPSFGGSRHSIPRAPKPFHFETCPNFPSDLWLFCWV